MLKIKIVIVVQRKPELNISGAFQNIRGPWRTPSKGTPQATSEGFSSLSLRSGPRSTVTWILCALVYPVADAFVPGAFRVVVMKEKTSTFLWPNRTLR